MAMLLPGDQAPFFHAEALGGNPRYAFDTAAGRPVLLLFLGSAGWPPAKKALATIARHRALFDDVRANVFGVSIDPVDVTQGRIAPDLPGVRWFVDRDHHVSRLYGATLGEDEGKSRYLPHWLVLDQRLRVVSAHPIGEGEAAVASLRGLIEQPEDSPAAPVLVLPRVFDQDLCRRLIGYYEATGGTESGFMREENGVTVAKLDHHHKKRADCLIEDERLFARCGDGSTGSSSRRF